MAKLWVFVLATAPFQVPIFWAAGWQVVTTLRERRIACVAAAEARALIGSTSSPRSRGYFFPTAPSEPTFE